MPGPLSSMMTRKRVSEIWLIETRMSGRIPASSQASRELSTPSLTVVSSAFDGLSKPSRCRFLAKNSETEMSRCCFARSLALERLAGSFAALADLAFPLARGLADLAFPLARGLVDLAPPLARGLVDLALGLAWSSCSLWIAVSRRACSSWTAASNSWRAGAFAQSSGQPMACCPPCRAPPRCGMFHSDLLAVNAPACRLGALLRNSLTECARG